MGAQARVDKHMYDPPCDTCQDKKVCGKKLMACVSLREFMSNNKVLPPARPTKAIYDWIYSEHG